VNLNEKKYIDLANLNEKKFTHIANLITKCSILTLKKEVSYEQ
jgi:hypothetical protein